jgi:hypothetical protein
MVADVPRVGALKLRDRRVVVDRHDAGRHARKQLPNDAAMSQRVGQDDVAGLLGVRNCLEPVRPHLPVRNRLVAGRREVQGSLEDGRAPVHARRRHFLRERVTPAPQLAGRQELDRSAGDGVGHVEANTGDVAGIAAARLQVRPVAFQRFGDRRGLPSSDPRESFLAASSITVAISEGF